MIEERLHGDDRGYGRGRVARPLDTAWVCAFGVYDPAGRLGAPLSKLRLTESLPPRVETRDISPLSSIRPIVSAIRRWRSRARSRPQLGEFDDHLLRDIGLRREDVAYGFPKPLQHWD